MPSRHLKSLPPESRHHHNHVPLLPPLLAGILTLVLLALLLAFVPLYRKLTRNRTAPSASPDLKSQVIGAGVNHRKCRRFSYSLLRRATSSFSASNKLGHGGFGSVYKAVFTGRLPAAAAVKMMNPAGSLQREREFHNELAIASTLASPFIVSLLGYSANPRKGKLLIVYELMENRSLQDALLDRKSEELMSWHKRFEVICQVARGLEYLHCFCDPPVIHGDVKPSNILLDLEFNAKIGDFGLARVRVSEDGDEVVGPVEEEDSGSILEEAERDSYVTTRSRGLPDSDASPEVGFDKRSMVSSNSERKPAVEGSRRDWWWKQDGNGVGESESGRVKDYVMEWIGSEISKERPTTDWIAAANNGDNGECKAVGAKSLKLTETKKPKKRLDWWASLDEERMKRKEKSRKPREWWKEEFCEELTKKKEKKMRKSKKRGLSGGGGESWWQKEDDRFCNDVVRERKKRKSRSSRGSIDWWLDGLSGELRNMRRTNQDFLSCEIPKSGGVSSTPSMRGTVCYIAPEYGGGSQLSEKCDVYSFGVLLLVVVSGRRPLQVTASPLSEFERANLISWSRQLAHNGKLLDLVDPSLHSLDEDQVLLCITIALLCLQRSPNKRPTMKEIVTMLSGEGEPPNLPFEFTPSPPSNFPFKSRRKLR